jgi:hypothetical protein
VAPPGDRLSFRPAPRCFLCGGTHDHVLRLRPVASLKLPRVVVPVYGVPIPVLDPTLRLFAGLRLTTRGHASLTTGFGFSRAAAMTTEYRRTWGQFRSTRTLTNTRNMNPVRHLDTHDAHTHAHSSSRAQPTCARRNGGCPAHDSLAPPPHR